MRSFSLTMNSKLAMLILALAGACIAGCQGYHPQPLNANGVDEALCPPPMSALEVKASGLHHPLLPPIQLDPRDGFSPDEAAVIAILVNPSLRAIRDRRALADAQLLQAGLLPNPQLSGSIEPVTGGVTANTFTGYSYGLSWDLKALITRRARLARARANRDAVDLDVAWQEWQVAQAARLAAYSLLGLEQQAALAWQMKDRLSENLKVIRQAVREGLVLGSDLAAAETAENQAQARLVDLEKQVRQQRLTLNEALGLAPDTPISLQAGMTLPSELSLPAQQEILQGLEQRRLDLVALRRGYQSQEAAVRVAILGQFPNITIGISQAGDTGNVITTPLAITVDLPIFDRNQAAIAQERGTRQQLYDEYVSRIFEAHSKIARLIDSERSIEQQLQVAQLALPSLQRLVKMYRRGVDLGQADVISYYTAWNDLMAKRLEIVAFKQQLVEVRIALEIAAGVYNLASLAHEPPTTQLSSYEVSQ